MTAFLQRVNVLLIPITRLHNQNIYSYREMQPFIWTTSSELFLILDGMIDGSSFASSGKRYNHRPIELLVEYEDDLFVAYFRSPALGARG